MSKEKKKADAGPKPRRFTQRPINCRLPEYRVWSSMKQRCFTPTNNKFDIYGGRGITVDPAWLGRGGFAKFVADVGRKPSPQHQIDRKDSNGDYTPGNCRWVTPVEQQNNRRSNHVLDWNGDRRTMSQWSSAVGIPIWAISRRVARGWSPERTLSTPYIAGVGDRRASKGEH